MHQTLIKSIDLWSAQECNTWQSRDWRIIHKSRRGGRKKQCGDKLGHPPYGR